MRKIALLFFVIFSSCNKALPPKVSFYYWKTRLNLSEEEKKVLSANDVEKLYVRYFDVELVNDVAYPVSPIHFQKNKISQQIIPVVFIKNEVFLSKKIDLVDLASKINSLVEQINTINKFKTTEYQIDCDWSLESKENYMKFLQLLKKESKKKLSVTIRLHQIKYFKETKIPPVDYGVLMFYNMGKLSALHETNSIYDKNVALNYIYSLKKYPLKLKIALPIFSWWVHTRNNSVINVISKFDELSFKNNSNFEVQNNIVYVKRSTLFEGFFFSEGDQLKLEKINNDDLIEMVDLFSNKLSNKPSEIIFYDLNTNNFKNNQNDNFFKNLVADF